MADTAVRSEQIRMLYTQGSSVLAANVINACVVAVLLREDSPGSWPIAWVGMMALLTAGRVVLRQRYLSAPEPNRDLTFGRAATIAGTATGLLWGLGAAKFFNPESTLSQLVLTFVIAGHTAGAAGSIACYQPAFFGYFLGALLPFVLRVAAVGDGLHLGMAGMLMVYGVVLIMVARGTHRAIVEAFRLRFENDRLVSRLSLASQDLEEANRALEQRVAERTLELERQGEQLRAARQLEALGRLAGGIGHDFNNLLTVVTANTYEVIDGEALSPSGRSALEDASEATARAADLVRQLLAVGRQQRLEPRTLDLNRLIREDERVLARLVGHDVKVDVVPAARALPVRVDPAQLHQILQNLAINARDAMPGGGTLTIRTDEVVIDVNPTLASGAYAVLSVADTGTGMDAETASRAFDPFFTTKGPGRGAGLGLATVAGIAFQSKGAIELETSPGHGATFRVFLPKGNAAEISETTGRPEDLMPIPRALILVAEDEPSLRAVVGRILRKAGHEVILAGDGAEAVALAEGRMSRLGLLVTDVMMPVMGGVALADALRALRADLPVLFMSGHHGAEPVPSADASHRAGYLPKPFTPEALLDCVSGLLRPKQ